MNVRDKISLSFCRDQGIYPPTIFELSWKAYVLVNIELCVRYK